MHHGDIYVIEREAYWYVSEASILQQNEVKHN
jgi:hypothetical protein